jgi:hypothetical protein
MADAAFGVRVRVRGLGLGLGLGLGIGFRLGLRLDDVQDFGAHYEISLTRITKLTET